MLFTHSAYTKYAVGAEKNSSASKSNYLMYLQAHKNKVFSKSENTLFISFILQEPRALQERQALQGQRASRIQHRFHLLCW